MLWAIDKIKKKRLEDRAQGRAQGRAEGMAEILAILKSDENIRTGSVNIDELIAEIEERAKTSA